MRTTTVSSTPSTAFPSPPQPVVRAASRVIWVLLVLVASSGCSSTPGIRDYRIEINRSVLAQGESEAFGLRRGVIEHVTGLVTSNPVRSKAEPSEAQWSAYWSTVDAIGVWGWRSDYIDNSVVGKGNWVVVLSDGVKAVAARGSNAYPPDGQFDALLEATRRLVAEAPAP